MHRRTFLTGLLGVAAAGVGASLASRAEALPIAPNGQPAPKPDASRAAEAKPAESLSERLPADAKIEPVQYRRYYRRRYYRRPYRRSYVRRRVCRTTWTRRGRRRVCTWR